MSKRIFIVRGPSGVGKSTYIMNNVPDGIVCSADYFFYDPNGDYKFDPLKLAEAHAACMKEFLEAIQRGSKQIVVDNTFTKQWEYENYVEIAKLASYEVTIVEIVPKRLEELKLCVERNQHGVSRHNIVNMVLDFEPSPTAIRLEMIS